MTDTAGAAPTHAEEATPEADLPPMKAPTADNGLLGVFHRRYLLRLLVRREISARYQGSFLGLLWSYINPLSQFCIYYFILGAILVRDIENFAIHIFSGADHRALLHRDADGGHPLHRAQQGAGAEDGDAARDVPGGLDARVLLPRGPADRDPAGGLRRGGLVARSRRARRPRARARAEHGAGPGPRPALQLRQRVLPRRRQRGGHPHQPDPVRRADDLQLLDGRPNDSAPSPSTTSSTRSRSPSCCSSAPSGSAPAATRTSSRRPRCRRISSSAAW